MVACESCRKHMFDQKGKNNHVKSNGRALGSSGQHVLDAEREGLAALQEARYEGASSLAPRNVV
jgi:hypothetical protein